MDAEVLHPVPAACAEFPNDNPRLHRGAILFCADLTGAIVWERVTAETAPLTPVAVPAIEVAASPSSEIDAGEAIDDIEIVENLAFDDAVDESEPPPTAIVTDPFANLVSVVEDVARSAGADDEAMARLASLVGRTRLESSAPDTLHALRAQALAWQGLLRSESDDFGACGGTMLDEWSAALIATVFREPSRADRFKRELRRRGVAAFGLVEQAA
jgi:hypothetical protein